VADFVVVDSDDNISTLDDIISEKQNGSKLEPKNIADADIDHGPPG
jgi:hypothetical protein